MTKFIGGILKTLGGASGLLEIIIYTPNLNAFSEPYRTGLRIGTGILAVLSFYSGGCGLNDLFYDENPKAKTP
jgi:hypothetical protein